MRWLVAATLLGSLNAAAQSNAPVLNRSASAQTGWKYCIYDVRNVTPPRQITVPANTFPGGVCPATLD
jgi:hypothetical protein